jgi:hypothetical protein
VAGEGRLGEETNGNLSWGRSRFFKDRSAIGYRVQVLYICRLLSFRFKLRTRNDGKRKCYPREHLFNGQQNRISPRMSINLSEDSALRGLQENVRILYKCDLFLSFTVGW